MSNRKYLPSIGDLIDRLSINQIKEVLIPEHKEQYAKEMQDIIHDIDLILQENELYLSAKDVRAIIILAQYNLHIWTNEANFRSGKKEGNNLELTHSLNGVRNRAKNILQNCAGGHIDFKIDCLAAEHSKWEPSW